MSMLDTYNTRYDNKIYRRASHAIYLKTPHAGTCNHGIFHLLYLAEYFAGVGNHPDCPPTYRAKLNRAVKHLPTFIQAIGYETWMREIQPFLNKMIG